MTGSEATPSFRLAYVPGVTPTKWVRIWNERLPDVPLTLVAVPAAEASALLLDGGADAGFVRLPVDRTDLSAIPLYTEATVVVIPKDHVVAAVDEISVEDLADEIVLHPLDDTLGWDGLPGLPAIERPATTADAIELVAAGVGVLAVPQSLARLHHRKDLTYRPLTGAPESRIALSWPQDKTTDLVEDFIGIVRGRTVNSTRGRSTAPAAQPKRKAPETGGTRRKPAAGAATGKGARSGSGGAKGTKGSRGAKGAAGARRGKPGRRP
ncbi:LysR family substrate-binding domain-containing protein [Streptomyces brevispora]|uniref:LysR family substrate-binding domain-containing protein n=1 Tax=Streptomyces brevispora TaxID=887462 RepID=A0ABZ1GCD8_9ACTN|nr:LysR family substrate-binding domain-containing protein [Streptomyces brevispora]WSC16827.1 LysR family substrate-binding domain-containing protein [Streptomyces brevispora]